MDEIILTKEYLKELSSSLAIRKMQKKKNNIEISSWPSQIAKINKAADNTTVTVVGMGNTFNVAGNEDWYIYYANQYRECTKH